MTLFLTLLFSGDLFRAAPYGLMLVLNKVALLKFMASSSSIMVEHLPTDSKNEGLNPVAWHIDKNGEK